MSRFTQHIVDLDILLDGKSIRAKNGTIAGLLALTINEEVNRIPRARLDMVHRQILEDENDATNFTLIPSERLSTPTEGGKPHDFSPGTQVTILLGNGEEPKVVFDGYVLKHTIEVSDRNEQIVSIECKHVANRMTLHPRTRFYHHQANSKSSSKNKIDPVSEKSVMEYLIQEVHSDLKLTLDVDKDLSRSEHENMTQYQCSDWDFMIMRAEANGLVCLPTGNTMKLFEPKVKGLADRRLILGVDILGYEAQYDETVSSPNNSYASWKANHDKVVTVIDSKANQSDNPDANKIQSDQFFELGAASEPIETKSILEGETLRQDLGKLRGLVRIKGTTEVEVGSTVAVEGFKSVWDGNAFVSGVRHEVRAGLWTMEVQCGLCNKTHAEQYGLDTTSSMMPQTNGLLYGVVSRYKKDQYGRELVEVEIASSNEKDSSSGGEEWEGKSVYARLSSLLASEERGAVFRPYPGDEVVLGFVSNDPRFPVVLGSVYNGKRKPLYDLKEDKTQEEIGFSIDKWTWRINHEDGIMEMKSPDGQLIAIEEADGDGKINVQFDANNKMELSKEGLTVKAKAITFEAQQDVTINGTNIAASAKQNVKIEGNAKVTVEGKVNTALKGQILNVN
jgi:uncharacterized protein involved in type VI secretion and phage assembly